MAKYLAEGRGVTLVTCTAGEMGEILVPELAHLAADKEDGLGDHRRGELADAMAALASPDGATVDHRWLGGYGAYRDSGMQWHADGYAIPADPPETGHAHDNIFWAADLTRAADDLVAIIREVRPQVLVTYDQFGDYGHPDHIQAHRVAMYAAQLAAVPSYRHDLGATWEIAKIYWSALPEERTRDGLRRLRAAGNETAFEGMDPDGPMPMTTPEADITAEIDAMAYVEQKLAAMRAYPTQISVEGPFFALSNNLGNEAWGYESFRIVKGVPVPGDGGVETDLFAGL